MCLSETELFTGMAILIPCLIGIGMIAGILIGLSLKEVIYVGSNNQ